MVIAVASESGVPIFSRKRGNSENVGFDLLNYYLCSHLNIYIFNEILLLKAYFKLLYLYCFNS